MKGFLTENTKISILSTTTLGAAAATTITSSALDMTGYEGVLFVVPFGTIVAGAVTSIKVQESATSGGSYADLTGSGQTIADTDDDKLFYVDVQRPLLPFLKLVVTRGTQNATVGGIFAIQYNRAFSASGGTSQGTNVSGEAWNAPAEGTA